MQNSSVIKLTAAQTARQMLVGMGIIVDHEDADLRTAVEQNRFLTSRYKAPHAYYAIPKRRPRRISTVLSKRLFKGHRP